MTFQEPTPSHQPMRVVGRYVLLDRIGSGGMATVHLGRLVGSGGSPPVAVKCLNAGHAEEPEFRTMLIDEARLSSRVSHPNVVATRDVILTGDEVMLVMEYVAGETLYRLLAEATKRAVPVPIPIAVRIAIDILRGLQAAHEATDEKGEPLHLVHRDVSPQNVMVGVDGSARLLDFGIAKARGRLHSTRDGGLKGKLSYMAPEQVRGEPVAQTDVFAAAAVLWEMLTGTRLFQAADEGATLNRVLNEPIPLPSTLRPEVSPALDHIVIQGLSRDLDNRYPSASVMADALASTDRLAGPQWVLEWVQQLVADRLCYREALVKRMMLTSTIQMSSASSTDAISTEPLEETVTHISVRSHPSQVSLSVKTGSAKAAPTGPLWPWFLLVGGALFATVALGMLFFASTKPAASGLNDSADPNMDAVAPRDSFSIPADATSSLVPSPAAPVASEQPDPVLPVTSQPTQSVTTKPKGLRTLPAQPPSTPKKPKCDNPTYVDENGIKRYRVDCL